MVGHGQVDTQSCRLEGDQQHQDTFGTLKVGDGPLASGNSHGAIEAAGGVAAGREGGEGGRAVNEGPGVTGFRMHVHNINPHISTLPVTHRLYL